MDKELRPATKLTVSVGGDERRAHHPLYQEVLKVLREFGVVGATLTHGVMGYGVSRQIHSTMNEITMDNLPIVIEAIDERERVEPAAERIAEILGQHGLVQLQPTMVIRYSSAEAKKGVKGDA